MSRWRSRLLVVVIGLLLFLAWARWAPMAPLFPGARSTVLLDRNGHTLAATVASDGQWRMPPGDSIPFRFEQCLIAFEDRHFRSHPGIHLPSMVRAWDQNRKAGRVVSGGSTITMQVARMARGDRPRTWVNKVLEVLLALRLELRFSKDEILALYCANAPFGGNVVGLEAASWRWFGKSPDRLGWAECATLAVLPNAPARIHPGRRRDELGRKRDRLLEHLSIIGVLDTLVRDLAMSEPLPDRPLPLPRLAPHLLNTLELEGHGGERIRSTIDVTMQQRGMTILDRHALNLRSNEIHNAAILVLDTRSGEALAYVGNLGAAGKEHAGAVDLIRAQRSTGSLLKPFLYAAMLQSGELTPHQLVADLPTQYGGFAPRNFIDGHDGAVPASRALARSLNVPAVRALKRHGVDRTLTMVRAMGLKSIDAPAMHYGLSLIVGGAESNLWELTGAYASLGRILMDEDPAPVRAPSVILGDDMDVDRAVTPVLNAASIHHTFKALEDLDRPELERGWQHFVAKEKIAWKTGTSFGHRDAWAIGVSDKYTVGVWVGNADGEGRPGLTGTLVAAPIMFEVFGSLPDGNGFDAPMDELEPMAICRLSGSRAGSDCSPVDTVPTIRAALRTPPCKYHRRIFVNSTETVQVPSDRPGHWVNWFVLPPAMEHYYALAHPGYRPLPSATGGDPDVPMGLIYPEHGTRIHLPIAMDGTSNQVVLHAAHRDPTARIDWDLDGRYLGRTHGDHRIPVAPDHGTHRLTLTDQYGRSLSTSFQCVRGGGDRSNE